MNNLIKFKSRFMRAVLMLLFAVMTFPIEAWADGYNVTFATGTEDVANWSISSTNPISGGTPITITYSGTKKVKSVSIPYTINCHKYVQMSDELKWATCNVGATNPQDYGNYYAWGETEPKNTYEWNNYKWMQNGKDNPRYITKYTYDDQQTVTYDDDVKEWVKGCWYEGDTFKGDNGDSEEHKDLASYNYVDDAARQNWGSTWRIPTREEWITLKDFDWEWTEDYNGTNVKGVIVTNNEANSPYKGNSIFLPAAGGWNYLINHTSPSNVGHTGFYWFSSLYNSSYQLNSSLGWDVAFRYDEESGIFRNYDNWAERCYGYSVRPVTSGDVDPHADISPGTTANTWTLTMPAGNVLLEVEYYNSVPSVAITDITAPVTLSAFDTQATCSTTGVTSNTVAWKNGSTAVTGNATAGIAYTVEVTLTPTSDYAFTSTTTATINGNTATPTLNADGTLTVAYTFPATTKVTLSVSGTATATAEYGTQVKDISISGLTVTYGDTQVAGSWAFASNCTDVPTVGGTTAYSATFTPSSGAVNYNTLTQDIVPTIYAYTVSLGEGTGNTNDWTITAAGNSITPPGVVSSGKAVTLSYTGKPANYNIGGYIVKDADGGDVSVTETEGVFSFNMPAKNVTIYGVRYYMTDVSYKGIGKNDWENIYITDAKTPDGTKVWVLDGTETDLGADNTTSWYVSNTAPSTANENKGLFYNQGITLNGDVNLILADGSAMTITTTSTSDPALCHDHCNLAIYGQANGTGSLCATGKDYGILVKNITINGGQVTATGDKCGIIVANIITLGWSSPANFIKASSYDGFSVQVAKGKIFQYTTDEGSGATVTKLYEGEVAKNNNGTPDDTSDDSFYDIDGKTLTPYGYGGYCGSDGKNMTWEIPLGSDGQPVTTLTISGTGEMANYDNADSQPWKNYRNDITSIVVESGVTAIDAINGFTNLESITINSDITAKSISAPGVTVNAKVKGEDVIYSITANGDVTAGSLIATKLTATNHNLTLTGTGSEIGTTDLGTGTLTVNDNAGGSVGKLTAGTVNVNKGGKLTATSVTGLSSLTVTGGTLSLSEASDLSPVTSVTLVDGGVIKSDGGSLTVGGVSGAGTIQGKDGIVLKSTINNTNLNIVAETKNITATDNNVTNIKAKSLTATDGGIIATGKDITAETISAKGTVTAGNIKAVSGENGSSGYMIFGWNAPDNFIQASSYEGTVKIADGQYFTYEGNTGGLLSGTLTADQVTAIAGKKLTPVSDKITVPKGSWATYYSAQPLTLGTNQSGAELYTISSVSETTATLSGPYDAMRAYTPMLIYNKGTETETILLIPCTDPDLALTVANEFKGTATDKEFSAGDMNGKQFYVLSAGKIFVRVSGAGTIAAHRCWLELPSSKTNAARSLVIIGNDDEPTSIENVQCSMVNGQSDSWYDMQGRKLDGQPKRKGVYIHGGKKEIIR